MIQEKGGAQTGGRLIGTVIPVGALRSEKSAGVGEFPDLIEFGVLCKKMGIDLVQLLPVNDTGYQSSPYSALTAFGLNPIYLRIGDLPEAIGRENDIDSIKEKFNTAVRFPYEAILRAKMDLLKKIYGENKKKINNDAGLKTWIEVNSWVKPYAVYRQLKEANEEKSWKEWSIKEASEEPFGSSDEHIFWAWLQYALDTQFSAAAAGLKELGICLMGDIPILMNEDSCDVWKHPELFDQNLSAGAPPDMYSPEGQNWGFPIYNWQAHSNSGYTWWKGRLKAAEKYYQAYRIDHVLGFFRIWAAEKDNNTSLLGRYVPYIPVNPKDFKDLKYDEGRISWVCKPHILTGNVWDALKADWGSAYSEEELSAAAQRTFELALERIDGEELWLFRKNIRGEKDINALDIHPAAKAFLLKAWGDRIFFEPGKDQFFPAWYYSQSSAYASLFGEEKECLEALLKKRNIDSEKIWEAEGLRLLSMLTASSSMLPCAEDLGAVPACVPKVLSQLGILGLRVVRWHRDWHKDDQPYIPFEDYPELSICTPAVHDSSCLREWWDCEADQYLFSGFIGVPSLPKVYNPGTARIFLNKIASAASRFRVFQIQDLLHLSNRWYAGDPASERINIPGTTNDFNWTYRLPATISEIMKDEDLIRAVSELAEIKPAVRKKSKS